MDGSGLSGAYLPTPPPDDQFPEAFRTDGRQESASPTWEVEAWMEIWDYAGGASFRAFIASDGTEKSLFVFFDIEGTLGRDLKKA
jgi:hypothetical protein